MKKIAILTSGGDSPGMNAAIISLTKSALAKKFEVFYVLEGFEGLYKNKIINSTKKDFNKYLNLGGTFLYSSRFPEFKKKKIREKAIKNLKLKEIDYLIVIGGDGSYLGAESLKEMGINVITLPGTIDNDINSTEYTIGYDTTLNTIVDSVDKLRDTSESHGTVMLVEVMGRENSDLAIFSGMATGAELIITKENKFSIKEIAKKIQEIKKQGHRSILIIISENVYDNIKTLSSELEKETNLKIKSNILSYIQRGGTPTAADRNLAWKMGNYSIELIKKNKKGCAIGVLNGKIYDIDLSKAIKKNNQSKKKLIEKINNQNKILKGN